MRQADSSIRGYIYQFNKSILEILTAADDQVITVEGTIEDIDICTSTGLTTIQCKYHESQNYKLSSIAVPILEMLVDYCTNSILGKKEVKYILYAYFVDNIDSIASDDFLEFLSTTSDKSILIKYFHKIYTITDPQIVALTEKERKNKIEKDTILAYYLNNRVNLKLAINFDDFWRNFTYIKAEHFDVLNQHIVDEFSKIVDLDTVNSLYYPNAFSKIAHISSIPTVEERTITKRGFLNWLSQQESVLITKWAIRSLNKEHLLRKKKEHLSTLFSSNPDIRAFFFSKEFLQKNRTSMLQFIIQYLDKYYKKPQLQRPPIFIFDDDCMDTIQEVVLGLYRYGISVNMGVIAGTFMENVFINNTDCSPNIRCKVASICNVNDSVLEQCHTNQFYIIGQMSAKISSTCFTKEFLEIDDILTLKYLVGLQKVLEAV